MHSKKYCLKMLNELFLKERFLFKKERKLEYQIKCYFGETWTCLFILKIIFEL